MEKNDSLSISKMENINIYKTSSYISELRKTSKKRKRQRKRKEHPLTGNAWFYHQSYQGTVESTHEARRKKNLQIKKVQIPAKLSKSVSSTVSQSFESSPSDSLSLKGDWSAFCLASELSFN